MLDSWDGSVPGIWEALGEVRGAFPDLGDQEARDMASSLLRQLALEGSIELCRVSTPDEGRTEPIAEAELEATLARPSSWQPTGSGGFTVNMQPTPAGERKYEITR